MAIWRVEVDGAARLAVGAPDEGPQRLVSPDVSLADVLAGRAGTLADVAQRSGEAVPSGAATLSPTDLQPVWAAGVTFERSRTARKEESGAGDFYDLVYDAERPELFLKAMPGEARGSGDVVAIRADSSWDVPEPELGLVVDCNAKIVGYVLANDMSSRSIEGANPLYLPQAKVYDGSCAVGPCIVPVEEGPDFDDIEMVLTIRRSEEVICEDSVSLSRMRRSPRELVDWLFLAHGFPRGAILLTGTSIVPGPEVTLEPGDRVTIAASGLGTLENVVERIGRSDIAEQARRAQ